MRVSFRYQISNCEDMPDSWTGCVLVLGREYCIILMWVSCMQAVTFDRSGQYLAVGGGDARVYGSKNEWSSLATFGDTPKKVGRCHQILVQDVSIVMWPISRACAL